MLEFHHVRGVDGVVDMPLNGGGITVRAVNTGETQAVPDVRLDEDYFEAVKSDYRALSEVAIPVMVGDRVVAVLNVESSRLGVYTDEDVKILEILSENVASAMSKIEQIRTIRESEEALVKSEERFKFILDSAPEGVAVNVLTKLVYVNRHLADMMGYTVDDLLNKNMAELHPVKYQQLIKDRTRKRALGEDVLNQYEVELIRKDGSIIPVEYSVSRISYNGEMASLTFIRDVSQRKEKQALQNRLDALHKHAHELNELRSMEEVAKTTLEILHIHLNCNLLAIRSSDGENLRMLARWGAEPYGKLLPIRGEGLMAKAARERQTLLVNDTHGDPDFLKGGNDALSELVVPILCRGELLGVFNAESLDLNAFGETDRLLMETLADEVGSAMMRIRGMKVFP